VPTSRDAHENRNTSGPRSGTDGGREEFRLRKLKVTDNSGFGTGRECCVVGCCLVLEIAGKRARSADEILLLRTALNEKAWQDFASSFQQHGIRIPWHLCPTNPQFIQPRRHATEV
jgi:hypothetical protein